MRLSSLLKKLVRFFTAPEHPCPICAITKTNHAVECISVGIQPNGTLNDSFTVKHDEDGNLWLVSFNRRCLTCSHIWYIPTGQIAWDKSRMRGPKLISVPNERLRVQEYIAKNKRIEIKDYLRIVKEERQKAGFFFNLSNGNWERKNLNLHSS